MLKFKTPEKDLSDVKEYIYKSKYNFSDFSLGAQYMWRKEFNYAYALVKDTFILRIKFLGKDETFCYPIGKDEDEALKEIEKYTLEKGIPLAFSTVDDEVVEKLKSRYADVSAEYSRDWCDYIYNAEDLKYFKGKKFSGQRNHLNKFNKLYSGYKFSKIEKGEEERVKAFFSEYYKTKDLSSGIGEEEFKKANELLEAMSYLNQVGGKITVGDKIAAVSIGEVVGNTLMIHVEKALRNYEGVYQAIVSEFAKAYAVDGVKYINREEDCGDEGLRTSKMQYHPIELKKKSFVKINTVFDRIKRPIVKAERLTLTAIKKEDKEDYYNICVDDENNKFWGYDYREDLKGEPTADYFYSAQSMEKRKRREYSFAVRLDGKMIGEAVAYNFNYFGKVETGIRIKKDYAGKGYGTEALIALDKYLEKMGAKVIKAKCFKENLSSKKLHEKAGYKIIKEDDRYYYFEK